MFEISATLVTRYLTDYIFILIEDMDYCYLIFIVNIITDLLPSTLTYIDDVYLFAFITTK